MRYNELSWPDRGRLWLRLLVRGLLFVAGLLFVLKIGLPIISFCMPFVLALVLTWLLEPLVRHLARKSVPARKAISIFLILLICSILGGGLTWIGYKIVIEVSALSANWNAVWGEISSAVEQVAQLGDQLMAFLPDSIYSALESVLDDLAAWFTSLGTTALIPKTTSAAAGIPSMVLSLIFFLMGTYFIMADFPRIGKVVTDWMPINIKAFFRFLGRTFQLAFGGYIRAELLLSLVVFFILVAGFMLLGIPYGFLLALFLAILDFIPIIGAGTVMVPWAVVEIVLGDWKTAVLLLLIWGVIVVFRRVAEPRFLDSQTGLHPLLALLAIYVGLKSFGVLGMVLAPTLLLVSINVCTSGVFDGLVHDVALAFEDLSAFLQSWRKQHGEDREEGNPFDDDGAPPDDPLPLNAPPDDAPPEAVPSGE